MKFFEVGRRMRRRVQGDTEFVTIQVGEVIPAPLRACASCGNASGPIPWMAPFRVELECWNSEFGDLAFGDPSEAFIATEHFRQVIHDSDISGLSGWEKVEIARVKSHKRIVSVVPGYSRVAVARSTATIDWQKSGFEWEQAEDVCDVCLRGGIIKRWKRIEIKPESWDGLDVFIPRGMRTIMASERFSQVCEEHGITNTRLNEASLAWGDFYPWDNFEKAKEMLSRPPGPDLFEKRGSHEIIRYERSTQYFVRARRDGLILKIDRPFDGDVFWEKQVPV